MAAFEDLIKSVIEGEEGKTVDFVHLALGNDISVREILQDGLIKAMNIVGEKF